MRLGMLLLHREMKNEAYHAIVYKLFKGLPIEEIDYHFDYEGMDAWFCEEFDIEQL